MRCQLSQQGRGSDPHLGNKHQSHGKVAAEYVGEGHESEGSIFLIGDDHGNGGGDDAEDGHVVDGHSHQPTVVNLFDLRLERQAGADQEDLSPEPHLDAPGLVGQEESQDEEQALVAVGETWSEECQASDAWPYLEPLLT